MTTTLFIGTRSLSLERDAELRAASAADHALIVADRSSAPYVQQPPAHFIAVNLADHAAATKTISDWMTDRQVRPSVVVGWTDAAPEIVAGLVHKFDLRGASIAAVCNARDKRLMRAALQNNGVPSPHFSLFSDYETFARAIETIGVPAVLKPSGASGGRGIFFVENQTNARDVYQRFRATCDAGRDPVYGLYADAAILEERIEGTEHSVAGIATETDIYILGIADKRIDRKRQIQFQNTMPSELPATVQEQLATVARQAVRALKLQSSGFHVDIMLATDGPRVLEVGARLGGECINSHLIPAAYGIEPYSLLLRYLAEGHMSGVPIDAYKGMPTTRAVARHIFPRKPGTIVSMSGLEELRRSPAVCDLAISKHPDESIFFPPDSYFDFSAATLIAKVGLGEPVNTVIDDLVSKIEIITK